MPTPETVKVIVRDQDTINVDGVLVRVFDATGTTFITSGVTGAVQPGEAEFTLDGDPTPGISYTLRFFKQGVSVVQPQTMVVESPPVTTNDFDVAVVVFSLDDSIDPRLCRATGFFRDASGENLPNLLLQFIAKFNPVIVDGSAVLGERVNLFTDSDGALSVELFRGGEYDVVISSLDDTLRHVCVPDQPSANLVHLLFPVVKTIVVTPDPISVGVNAEVEITAVVTGTNGIVAPENGVLDVIYSSSDEEVFTVRFGANGTVFVRGVANGTGTVEAVRKDQTIVVVPDPVVYTPVVVTVS